MLTEDAFTAPREISLEAGKSVELPDDPDTATCGAASIAFADGSRELVFWRDLDEIEGFVPADDEQRLARRVLVKKTKSGLTFALGDNLSAFDLGAEPPEPTCEEPNVTDSLTFSMLPMAQAFLEVGELRTADDGCLEADWFAGQGTEPLTQRLCVPAWAFPFEEGDSLAVLQATDANGGRSLRITRYEGADVDTQLLLWNDARAFEGSRIKKLSAADCVGQLTECGAYVRPLSISVSGGGDPLAAGQDVTIKGDKPRRTRVLIGRARDVAWSSATCTGGESYLGPTANALELREF